MGAATENIPMSKHAEKIYVGTFHAALGLMSEANFIIAPYAFYCQLKKRRFSGVHKKFIIYYMWTDEFLFDFVPEKLRVHIDFYIRL